MIIDLESVAQMVFDKTRAVRLELIEDIYPLTQLGEGAQINMQWLSKAPMSLLKFLV